MNRSVLLKSSPTMERMEISLECKKGANRAKNTGDNMSSGSTPVSSDLGPDWAGQPVGSSSCRFRDTPAHWFGLVKGPHNGRIEAFCFITAK